MRYARGFTLVEVVVSIFILGVLLILLQAVVRSASLIRVSKDSSVALAIARNELEGQRSAGYASTSPSGSFSDSLLASLPNATGTIAVTDYNAQTKQVTVSVSWQEPDLAASSSVSLTTLVTKNGGLP